jgi:hypothetical protein
MQFVSSRAMAEAREECVGRYEITMPDDADVALTIPTAFSKPQQNPIRFSNDQPAVHSVFIYSGTFRIARTTISSISRRRTIRRSDFRNEF